MSWVKLDDRASENRKLLAVGAAAAWLWTCGLMYCNRQPARDGFIPDGAVPTLYGPLAGDRKLAAKLVAAGLWERVEGGYKVHDYHHYQPSSEGWSELREKRRIAGSLGGKAKANGQHRAKQVASTRGTKSLPDPDPGPDPDPECENAREMGSNSEPSSHTRLRPAPERYVQPTDPLPDELREAAGMIGVQDVPNAWLKFCGKNAGQWRHVAGAWQSFCATWVQVERRERNAKQDAADAAQAANTERSRRVDERQREHDAEWARREAERAPPPPELLNLVKKVGKR